VTIGGPVDGGRGIGPLSTEAARDRVAAAVESARSSGARVLTGGVPGDGDGWFLSPALVADVTPDQELAREEVFGPVLALFAADDLDEAVRMANSTRYGLVAAVFTKDLA